MPIDPRLKTLTPWQYIIFKTPNPVKHRCYLRTPMIRIAVLDSAVPFADDGVPRIAAMIVPDRRERDWNFCTESGHLQLLSDYPSISRLILIGKFLPPNSRPPIYTRPPESDTVYVDRKKLENALRRLVMRFHPTVSFENGLPKTQFLAYEDDLLYRVIVATFVGPVVGEFVVEDVLMEDEDDVDQKLRRNLRFKRMPNLVQSQIHIHPIKADGKVVTDLLNLENLKKIVKKSNNVKFRIDPTILVHSYLTPMVSGLSLITSHLNERLQQAVTPRALCLGVGGGCLLTFLNTQLGFEVVGVEADEVVLSAAKQFFGLDEKSIQLIVGDAIDLIQNFVTKGEKDDSDSKVKIDALDAKFDVVIVDLDSSNAYHRFCSPPPKFVKKSVFQGAKLLLDDNGIFIINVVSPNKAFDKNLVRELKDAFHNVYKVILEEEYKIVLMATVSAPSSYDGEDLFLEKLRYHFPELDTHLETIDEL